MNEKVTIGDILICNKIGLKSNKHITVEDINSTILILKQEKILNKFYNEFDKEYYDARINEYGRHKKLSVFHNAFEWQK